jgi:hypothetical protein
MRNKTKYTEKYHCPRVGGVDGVATAMSACRQGLSRYISAVGRLEQRAALSKTVGAQLFLHRAETKGQLARNHTLNESPYD